MIHRIGLIYDENTQGLSYKGYSIKNCGKYGYCKVSDSIEPGDIFNVYYGETLCGKEGVEYLGDIELSLLVHNYKDVHYDDSIYILD